MEFLCGFLCLIFFVQPIGKRHETKGKNNQCDFEIGEGQFQILKLTKMQ